LDPVKAIDGEAGAVSMTAEVIDARAWFAAICRTDLSATIRMFTNDEGAEVWSIRWQGKQNLFLADAGEPLSSLMVHAMRTDKEARGVVDV
jgi:hypothetical protein